MRLYETSYGVGFPTLTGILVFGLIGGLVGAAVAQLIVRVTRATPHASMLIGSLCGGVGVNVALVVYYGAVLP